MAAVNIEFPGNLAQVERAADLRSIPPASSDYAAAPLGMLFAVADLQAVYTYDPGSTAADDNATVIRPSALTPLQAGRWVKSFNGFAPGLPGKDGLNGASNNTVASVSGLRAAPVTGKSALLATTQLSAPFAYSSTAPDAADDANVVAADAGGFWVNMMTSRQKYPSAKSRNGRPGGTDNEGVTVFLDAYRGSMFVGGTDTAPQNDEGNLWSTIMGSSAEGIGRAPKPADQGVYSEGIGRNSFGYSDYSYARGHDSIAFGVASMVGGAGSATGDPTKPKSGVASFLGYCAFAWGKVVQAIGQASAALGERTIASSRSAMAFGYKAIAQNSLGAFAAGNDVQTSSSGDWSAALGQYLRASGSGASNIGRGVNPGSPSDNATADTLGIGMNVLRPTVLFISGSPGNSYSGTVVSRTGWRALGDVGAAIDQDFGGITWPLTNGGGGGYAAPLLTGRFAGNVIPYLTFDAAGKYPIFYGDRVIDGTARTIPTSTSTGVAGERCWDSNYEYRCIAANTWTRTTRTATSW